MATVTGDVGVAVDAVRAGSLPRFEHAPVGVHGGLVVAGVHQARVQVRRHLLGRQPLLELLLLQRRSRSASAGRPARPARRRSAGDRGRGRGGDGGGGDRGGVVATAVVRRRRRRWSAPVRWAPRRTEPGAGQGERGRLAAGSSTGVGEQHAGEERRDGSIDNPVRGCDAAGRASHGEWRTGFSTRRYETAATTTDPATTASRWTTDSGPHVDPDEHQRRPVPQVDGVGALPDPQHRRAAEDGAHARPAPSAAQPAAITSAVPSTGAAAANPGNVVRGVVARWRRRATTSSPTTSIGTTSGAAGSAQRGDARSPAARRSAAPTPASAASRTPTACCCR